MVTINTYYSTSICLCMLLFLSFLFVKRKINQLKVSYVKYIYNMTFEFHALKLNVCTTLNVSLEYHYQNK